MNATAFIRVDNPSNPFMGCSVELRVTYPPNYPFKPPRIRFVTKVNSPDVNDAGELHLPLLREKYYPACSMVQILDAVVGFLDNLSDDQCVLRLMEANEQQRGRTALIAELAGVWRTDLDQGSPTMLFNINGTFTKFGPVPDVDSQNRLVVECTRGHQMALLHEPPTDPAYHGQLGTCDGGGRGGCRRTVSAAAGYYHCDPCQGDCCDTCAADVTPRTPSQNMLKGRWQLLAPIELVGDTSWSWDEMWT